MPWEDISRHPSKKELELVKKSVKARIKDGNEWKEGEAILIEGFLYVKLDNGLWYNSQKGGMQIWLD